VRCASVEGFPRYTCARVERGGRQEVHIAGYDDVVGGVEVGVLFVADIGVEGLYGDAWVEPLDLGGCCFGALDTSTLRLSTESEIRPYVFADVGVADEELCAEIIFGDYFVVCEGDGAYAGEDQVLCDFVGERLDGDEEDVGGADLLLRLHAPEADLPIIEGDFVCASLLVRL
jgi:hypothetical protein